MNIKHSENNLHQLNFNTKNYLQSPKQLQIIVKSKAKKQNCSVKKILKKNLKQSSNSQGFLFDVKPPPHLKRQNTEQSPQIIRNNGLIKQTLQFGKGKLSKNSNPVKRSKQSGKFQSDQQSTNIYRYNKQSADQQQDPYKITQSQRLAVKQKSIQPSRDLSISLMCRGDQKAKYQKSQQSKYNQKNNKSKLSIHKLKEDIKQKLKKFKSLTKYHQTENEYFVKKIGINKQEQKRLEKIQQFQKKSLKNDIFQLKDQIDVRLKNKN